MVYLSNTIQQKLTPYNNWITILCAISQHKSTNTILVDNESVSTAVAKGSDHTNTTNDQIRRISLSSSSVLSVSSNKMTLSITGGPSCCYLPMLNQGIETKIEAYSKLIAEYIGIPTGQNLISLRETAANISLLWGL